jgi:hypothetical protein
MFAAGTVAPRLEQRLKPKAKRHSLIGLVSKSDVIRVA